MDLIAVSFAVGIPAAFAAGVVFHKYVISEAQAIKTHVSNEVSAARQDVASALQKFAAKL